MSRADRHALIGAITIIAALIAVLILHFMEYSP